MTVISAPVADRAPTGPDPARRPVRVPQLLLSLLVIAVFALLAVWWQARTTERSPVLALAQSVEAGVPLTSADLTEMNVSTDIEAAVESPEFRDLFVGVRPVTDLPAGTIVTAEMFRANEILADHEALVGLRVSPDEAPPALAPGDRVQVLMRGDSDLPDVLAPDAIVETVELSRDGATSLVQLRMGVAQAQQVQVWADRVVLIEIGPVTESSWDIEAAGTAVEPEESDGP